MSKRQYRNNVKNHNNGNSNNNNGILNFKTPKVGDICGICLEKMIEGDNTIKLPCNHSFHKSCYTGLVKYSLTHKYNIPKCPLCRGKLGTESGRIMKEIGINSESLTPPHETSIQSARFIPLTEEQIRQQKRENHFRHILERNSRLDREESITVPESITLSEGSNERQKVQVAKVQAAKEKVQAAKDKRTNAEDRLARVQYVKQGRLTNAQKKMEEAYLKRQENTKSYGELSNTNAQWREKWYIEHPVIVNGLLDNAEKMFRDTSSELIEAEFELRKAEADLKRKCTGLSCTLSGGKRRPRKMTKKNKSKRKYSLTRRWKRS
jgi:hypothetical protein